MVALEFAASYKGQPIDTLQRLIEKRMQFAGECARDAVIGTAITVLKSIRALTRDARQRRNFDNSFTVADTGYYGGYSQTEKRRVVRQGVSKYSPKVKMDAGVKFTRDTRHLPQYLQHIYKVDTMRHYRGKPLGVFYICARSAQEVAERERNMIRRQIKRSGGLALNALSAAMARCSTRNPPAPVGSQLAQTLGDRCTIVSRGGGGGGYFVSVTDTLNYAASALKGGDGALNLAMMRAANKISGMIRHSVYCPLDADVPTPFPEIVR